MPEVERSTASSSTAEALRDAAVAENNVQYVLPGVGAQMNVDNSSPKQAAPLLRYYSPRLFGAPPQLTNQCDMRILSGTDNHPGPVGDFYLTKILQDAHVANFVVGRARFTGGVGSKASVIREMFYYGKALKDYDIFDRNGGNVGDKGQIDQILQNTANLTTYQNAVAEAEGGAKLDIASKIGNIASDLLGDEYIASDLDVSGLSFLDTFSKGVALISAFKTSLSVQQPFYTFEDDWYSYINNVKMMINTAVIMLGLQSACVRIGDNYYPIGMEAIVKEENDVWANYRAITPTTDLGDVTAEVKSNGDTSQYVSFMIDPTGVSEQYTNNIGESTLMASIMSQGNSIGNEIAFITNSTVGNASDSIINLAKESKEAANEVLKTLGDGSSGRFTAAIATSMAKSFVGDHTIYPMIFQSHTATSSMSVTVHLVSDAGDPYSYLINILVPMFYILGMALPSLSSSNASAYTYPPIIQCNIPGMWGTRLGMVQSVSFNKNPNSKEVSINGYPLSVDVTINIADLQHVLLTSPMNKISMLLNNQTMYDYIAQCSGVDKFRVNGAMRTIARLALATSAALNTFNNIGDAVLTDWHSIKNKIFRWEDQ